jgi:hypothetical protein
LPKLSSLQDRYAKQIAGSLACFDRIVVTGTIPKWCYAVGMSLHLSEQGIRIFDYTRFAEPLREEIRANAERLAQENGIEIEFIRSAKGFRKEDRIKAVIASRGEYPGLVHIFSAMESCPSYAPWHDKKSGRTFLRSKEAKCLHYYFYFIDSEFGLCYMRVPTWAPFRLQFYCNGHNWLANQLRDEGIDFTPLDNAFLKIDNFARAQELADLFPVERLHRALDAFAKRYCPVIRLASDSYYWSIMQAEYSTDIVFKRTEDLQPLYETLVKTAIHTVRPEQIAMFLGKKLDGRTCAEIGTDYKFSQRIQGTRIKHYMGWASIKAYDKQGIILRIETTVNDISELKHYRTVEHRDGTTETKYAPMQKTIYSLPPLRELLLAANNRYIDFLSSLEDPSDGERQVKKIGNSIKRDDRSYRGFNLFSKDDLESLVALMRGEGNISGITNRLLRRALPGKSSSQISYFIKRCRVFGLIKKCAKAYKYYLTKLGRITIIAALRIRAMLLPPIFSQYQHA